MDDKLSKRSFLFLFGLFTFVPLLHFPHPGGSFSLMMPFNIFTWEIAASAIFFSAVFLYQNRSITYPRHVVYLLAVPLVLICSGIIAGITWFNDWFFRSSAIFLGVAFFMSLFQFKANRHTIEQACYVILAGMLLQAAIAALQMLPVQLLAGLIAYPPLPSAQGIFMQPNLLASYMATGSLLSIYLLTTPGFRHKSLLVKILTTLSLTACTAIALSTGSRIGMLSLALCIPIMIYARYNILQRNKASITLLTIALFTGIGAGASLNNGVLKAYSKMERLAEEGKDVRWLVYGEGFNLFMDSPLTGHGIGSFQSAFHEHMADVMDNTGGEPLIGYGVFNHPHNELLIWAIEGGLPAVIAILIFSFVVVLQAWRQGRQRGLAIIALLLPLSLHSQVEFPFYSSAPHWFLFLFLLFLLFSHGKKNLNLNNVSILNTIPVVAIVILASALYICTDLFKTNRSLTEFLVYKQVNLPALERAQNNLYFSDLATRLRLATLLSDDISLGTTRWTQEYISWAEGYISHEPSAAAYHDLILAYHHLGLQDKVDTTVKQGLYLFPKNPAILETVEKITQDSNRPANTPSPGWPIH